VAIRAKTGHRRCDICRLHFHLCICDRVKQMQTRTTLTMIMHRNELSKTTNTGVMACHCLSNSRLLRFGVVEEPLPDPLFSREERPVLLFPHDHGRPLSDFRHSDKPINLVIPDGTWRQASKMSKRVPGLLGVECAYLPPGEMSKYQLRTNQKEGGLSTMEAVARAFGVLEGEAVQAELEHAFRLMIERILWMKGKIKTADVYGGLPEKLSTDPKRHPSEA
jgi:DTW domain-containing protein YfiP